jgi:multimeric flavodoxin WrbA
VINLKILGISGSPRKDETSGTYKLVRTVLQESGCDHELIPLRGEKIHGCIACLRCVEDNVCKVEDDMFALRDKILEADAYVLGAPNYYSGLNAATHAFLERWFQFRHQDAESNDGAISELSLMRDGGENGLDWVPEESSRKGKSSPYRFVGWDTLEFTI